MFKCQRLENKQIEFQLHVPVKLKGVEVKTRIRIHMYPEDIVSFRAETTSSLPSAVESKLKCACMLLSFRLHKPLSLIVPVTARVPPQPKSKSSGAVLDHLRTLCRATVFGVYIPDKAIDKAGLDAIQHALSKADGPSLSKRSLQSLFGDNTKGKIVRFDSNDLSDDSDKDNVRKDDVHKDDVHKDDARDAPPTYRKSVKTEDQPLPPYPINDSPPSKLALDRKRRRLGSSDSTATHDSADYTMSRHEIESRLAALATQFLARDEERDKKQREQEQELQQLRSQLGGVKATVRRLRRRLDEAREEGDEARCDIEAVKKDLDEVWSSISDINDNGFDAETEERILDNLSGRVFDHIGEKRCRATVVIESIDD